MRLHRQMTRGADEAGRERHEFWVVKLLALLSDTALRTGASACVSEPKSLVIECNFADQVWDDPRVEQRVQTLTQQGISVEKQDHMMTIAGQSFTRRQLVLTF